MIIEVEKQTKLNQFYWFTAKKIPYDADVSYTSKENYLYGFKQAPSYYYVENYDLRFITHATLDELIEQFG